MHFWIIMMRKTRHPPRNIAIAAPRWMECVPISLAAMWWTSSTIAETTSRNVFLIWVEAMGPMQLFFQMVEIGVLRLAPG